MVERVVAPARPWTLGGHLHVVEAHRATLPPMEGPHRSTGTGRDRAERDFELMAKAAVPTAGRIRALGYVPALDGIRGVAVLLVIATHSVLLFWPSRFDDVVPGGFLGVDLFFVLSDFLISGLLPLGADRGRIGLTAFWVGGCAACCRR